MSKYVVTVKRSNGRFVKDFEKRSRYAAKRLKSSLEAKYDETYRVEVTKVIG